jgi:hypothetical protein
MTNLRGLARLVLWVAIVLFIGIGISGVLLGPWELTHLVVSDLDALSVERATVLNQFRFLKAMELSMGVVLLALHRDVLDDARVNRAVQLVLWLTPLARVVSVAVDGWPHPMFSALMFVELTGALVMSAYAASRFPRKATLSVSPPEASRMRG